MAGWQGKSDSCYLPKGHTDPRGQIKLRYGGDGRQTRSFLYIDECLEGIERLMQSSFAHPVNIGSDEMISIQALTEMTIDISGKKLAIENIKGPTGVENQNV